MSPNDSMHSEARAHDEYMGYAGDDAPERCKDCGEIEDGCVCLEPLAEAKAILAGTTMMLPTLEHLRAMRDHLVYIIGLTRAVEETALEKLFQLPGLTSQSYAALYEPLNLLSDSIAALKAWEENPLP